MAKRARLIDVGFIAVVPLVILGVYALPYAVRVEYVLYYGDPTVLTAYTSQFVHLSPGHLLINLVYYVLVVPTIYLYWTIAGRRKTFFAIFTVIMVAFPFLLSWVNLSLVRDRFGYGFSGVNAAFLGTLPLALMAYLRTEFEIDVSLADAPYYFFVGVALIAGLSLGLSKWSLSVGLLALGGALLYGEEFVPTLVSRAVLRQWLRKSGFGELAAIGHLLFFLFPFLAFPVLPGIETPLANYFIHLIGFSLGFLAPFVTLTAVDIH
ncbi:MAG: hypothetical protein ACOCTH_02325 [Halodesulfurarchaeum sp.]